MRAIERVLPITRNRMAPASRYLLDTVLACAGSLSVTGVLLAFHLFPASDAILIIYLPVVLLLAIVRGRYAAILSTVVTSLSLAYFTIPLLNSPFVYHLEEWLELSSFLIVAMLIGHLAATLRKREQDALARASELFATFEAMTEGVSICDTRGEIHYTNTAYRSLLELNEDADPSLLGLDTRIEWSTVRDLEGRPLPREQIPVLRVLRGERLSGTHTIDLLCRTRKGEDLIVNVSGAPICDTAGEIAGGVVVFRDVTERYRLEQQLQYSERKLRSLVESNIFGVVVVDLDGHFYEANDRFVQMVGYSKEELLSGAVTWQQLNLPEYQEVTAQAVRDVLSTGVMYRSPQSRRI